MTCKVEADYSVRQILGCKSVPGSVLLVSWPLYFSYMHASWYLLTGLVVVLAAWNLLPLLAVASSMICVMHRTCSTFASQIQLNPIDHHEPWNWLRLRIHCSNSVYPCMDVFRFTFWRKVAVTARWPWWRVTLQVKATGISINGSSGLYNSCGSNDEETHDGARLWTKMIFP